MTKEIDSSKVDFILGITLQSYRMRSASYFGLIFLGVVHAVVTMLDQ